MSTTISINGEPAHRSRYAVDAALFVHNHLISLQDPGEHVSISIDDCGRSSDAYDREIERICAGFRDGFNEHKRLFAQIDEILERHVDE